MLNANTYRSAVQTALPGADPLDIPPIECTELILTACQMEGFDDPTTLCVPWRRESLFYQHPCGNPRADGGCDCGPIQAATTWWDKSPFTDGLPNAFGTTRSKTEPFDGDPLENLRVGVRAYAQLLKQAKGDRGDAAGLFRFGHVDETPGTPYAIRKAEFWGIVKQYDLFFQMMRGD